MYADSGEVSAQSVQAPLLNQLQYVNKPHCLWRHLYAAFRFNDGWYHCWYSLRAFRTFSQP